MQKPLHVGISDRIAEAILQKNKAGEQESHSERCGKIHNPHSYGFSRTNEKIEADPKPERLGLTQFGIYQERIRRKISFDFQYTGMKNDAYPRCYSSPHF